MLCSFGVHIADAVLQEMLISSSHIYSCSYIMETP